ncbi:hypothetical protein ACQ3G6_11520 [Allorhizobium undicola]|uniref:hypothetical protein n=1 Tax=Allorhizobium undicola TaxID=78527 RepID=UPI000B272244|nr:hypothetical protein [Allorhizobium undicola]
MDAKSSAQVKTPAQASQTVPSQTIPSHIVERLEAEWRQMRMAAPQPANDK